MFPYTSLKIRSIYAFFLAFILSLHGFGQSLNNIPTDQFKFRHIGPVGNRVTSVVGIPGNDQVYYVGAASGGIWKTVDAGLTWKPVFDKQDVHSIGALALATSDQQVIYAGTGESFIRSNVSIGNGMYKSTDGGDTWTHIGLKNTGRISRVVVHPSNPDIVYATALGHAYSPQKERGIYKTTDGGKSWRQVLFVDENTGFSDLVMDTSNPRILFAGAWQLSLKTWNRTSGGKGSGIFKSIDGGETWQRLSGNGLPEGSVGKIALAMTSADPDKVYALIETGDGLEEMDGKTLTGELWVSPDKGKKWNLISHDRELAGRQPYYTRTAASPDNPNEVYFIAANFSVSLDGGKSLISYGPSAQPNWDHHEMWIDPTNGDRMAVAGDGGISFSENRGKTWHRFQLPVAQLYHVTTDNAIPYNVLTNRQDGPAMRGPSRSNTAGIFGSGIIPTGLWFDVGGGESGFATPDPKNPDIVWSSASGFGALGGVVTRWDAKTKQYRHLEIWPELTVGNSAEEVKYRFQWTFPLLISPHDNNTIFVTSQVVHKTMNNGQSWEVISPDLTLNDKSKQKRSGGLTPDNIGVEYANVIYAFEESPVKKGVYWAGTNDGLIQVSKDGGKTWENVSKNIKNLPPLGTVRNIDASDWEEGKAYVTIDFHEVGNFEPHVYKTTNFGKSWAKITNGIDNHVLSYARVIREDPVRKGLLYLGTENKLYVSFDDGVNWQTFMSNLPPAPMYWIDIQKNFNDLVLGTYGRGIWILDDISPLQQLPADFGSKKVWLFKPGKSYRFQPVSQNMQFFPEASSGTDPQAGVPINYWLKEDTDSVKIKITNPAGDTLKTITHKGKKGINRVYWNYTYDNLDPVQLRTTPVGADWVSLGKDRKRKAPLLIDMSTHQVVPGKYKVGISIGEEGYSEEFELLKDPNSEGTLAEINEQVALLDKIRGDLKELTEMINESELIRRQLYDMSSFLTEKEDATELVERTKETAQKFTDIEGEMIQLKVTGRGQDAIRNPVKLMGKLNYLAMTVSTGDFRPTDEQQQVYELLSKGVVEVKEKYEKLKEQDLVAYRKFLAENGVEVIVVK